MKIGLLSGARKNSGDYLITNRCRKILEANIGNAEITVFNATISLEDKIDELNNQDLLIIAGGPSYTKKLYPRDIPLVSDLRKIETRIAIIGSGWYGNLTDSSEIYRYKFLDSSRQLLDKVQRDVRVFGCRDYYAVRVLANNGYSNAIMTGCPAWYDLEKLAVRLNFPNRIKKIMISDPADIRSYSRQSLTMVKRLKEKYPDATIEYVFHRGVSKDELTDGITAKYTNNLINELKKLGVQYHDIAYGAEGFKLYDSCDLHIGHRVHAHIYNLSKRRMSILIEEDSRGAGVNEALGLVGIKAYKKKISSNANNIVKLCNKISPLTITNDYVFSEIEHYIDYICMTKGFIFDRAFSNMENYYQQMSKHIKIICDGNR